MSAQRYDWARYWAEEFGALASGWMRRNSELYDGEAASYATLAAHFAGIMLAMEPHA